MWIELFKLFAFLFSAASATIASKRHSDYLMGIYAICQWGIATYLFASIANLLFIDDWLKPSINTIQVVSLFAIGLSIQNGKVNKFIGDTLERIKCLFNFK